MRKITCLLLCVLFLLSLSSFVLAAESADLTISNAEEFLSFAENCRLDSYSQDLTVSLIADIDLSQTEFSGIPIFCGTFLGNGHRITGLNITGNGSEQGLFRYLTESALVEDLHISGTVAPAGSRNNVGGITGHNAGIIRNCSFSGNVSGNNCIGGIAGENTVTGIIEECHTDGSIRGSHFIGGIAGENNGVIRSCENAANINDTEQQNDIDISDVTIETITGTESASTVTDIGGIAGISSGSIRLCKNIGNVGYKHIGYNIGGITGTLSGYLSECENAGAVSGRKDVGGIAGHMEPAIALRYETDTLQILQGQLVTLSGLTDKAVLNAQTNTNNIRSLINTLKHHAENAQAALDVLTIDPENPELKDIDTYVAAVQSLGSNLKGYEQTLRTLSQAVENTGDDLYNDLNAIAEQVNVIQNTLNQGEDSFGGSMEDISDTDTDEDLSSKLSASTNSGAVLGDTNVGGIVGTMAIENDLDPDKDILISGDISLNLSGQIRSVVTLCSNLGTVTAKKNHAGGIVGWQSLGLIKSAVNTGSVIGADYVGGIAGQSLGKIRGAIVKAAITGDVYVGGIAGSGTIVTQSHSMVSLSGNEKLGAILGGTEDSYTEETAPFSENLYVPVHQDIGAIDGISYAGKAEATTLENFLTLENIPESMKSVTVTFQFEDGTSQSISLIPGEKLEDSQIPDVPEKQGYNSSWDGIDALIADSVLFDTTVKAIYISYDATVASEEINATGKPVLLVQGAFPSDFTVAINTWELSPTLSEKETLLACHSVSFSHPDAVTNLRYLIPDNADTSELHLYVHTSSGWSAATYAIQGSYAVIAATADIDGIALTAVETTQVPWILIGAGAAALLLIGCILLCKRKKTTATPEETAAK